MPAIALPDEIKEKKGSLQKSRVNKSKPAIEPGIVPAPPEEMADRYKAMWYSLKEAVEYLGVYAHPSDYNAFKTMVIAVYQAQLLGPTDDISMKELLAFRKQALDLLIQFGLTPLARSKVSTLGQKQLENELSEFLGH